MERIDRREFLKLAALGPAVVGTGALITACGSSHSASTTTAAAGKPRRGGALQGAISGGGSSDTLDPLRATLNTDWARVNSLFEPLVLMNAEALPELLLAEELVPNSDATEWTTRVRKGVTFHDGKELTADDVIYTFQQILNPKNPGSGAPGISTLDVSGMKKLDKYTVRLPFKAPYATLKEMLSAFYYDVVPVGFDPKHPVGTGPFKLVSFTPGQQSTVSRYEGYWQSGLPYLDSVVISDYADQASQLNALLSGQADIVNLLTADATSQVTSGGKKLLISDGGGWNPFTMRVDQAPFNDSRVRQAMRLIVNRHEMRDVVFGGHGTLGNDIFGIWAPDYDHSIPQREQDIGRAKSLLKAAGADGMTFELVTSDLAQGVVGMAEVFAQQASAAGVHVNLNKVTVSEFYGPNYLKWTFAQDYWYYNYYLPQIALAELPTAPYNETHWNDPHYNKLYSEATATLDVAKRRELAYELQKIDYNDGAYIIPFFPAVIDAYGTNVHGFVTSKTGVSFNNYDFRRIWLS